MAEENKFLRRFAKRVGYTPEELEQFQPGDPRLRQIEGLSKAAGKYSIQAQVVSAKNCNSGYQVGDTFLLDVDGNFITKLCPPRLCVYALSQLVIPVALINERLSEGLDPISFISCIRSDARTRGWTVPDMAKSGWKCGLCRESRSLRRKRGAVPNRQYK